VKRGEGCVCVRVVEYVCVCTCDSEDKMHRKIDSER
jgi:hypothetical protein